jgi:hypothetical protein
VGANRIVPLGLTAGSVEEIPGGKAHAGTPRNRRVVSAREGQVNWAPREKPRLLADDNGTLPYNVLSAREDICFVRGKFQPANWYGLKDRVFRDGVALSVPGYLILLDPPWVNL